MSTLTMLKGVPASGKSVWAIEQVKFGQGNIARLNRDSLRLMMHAGQFIKGVTEQQIIAVEREAAYRLLKAGVDVIIDDTNLTAEQERMWKSESKRADAAFEIKYFEIDLATAIERDKKRVSSVGEAVIRSSHQKLMSSMKARANNPEPEFEENLASEIYVPDHSLPKAIIADIDGTLALHTSGRDPYDLSRVHEDSLNEAVAQIVNRFFLDGYTILYMTGRDESGREATELWLKTHLPDVEGHLFMRPYGDHRKDNICKLEMFNEYARNRYDIHFVIDDRNSVVSMWRSIGLACLQCNEGDF